MKLSSLFSLLEKSPLEITIHNAGDCGWADRTGVCDLGSDSRKVRPGSVFACVEGEHSDGHDFANEAELACHGDSGFNFALSID